MPNFEKWKELVDKWYQELYGITLADAGESDEDLKRHWPGMAPREYVEWQGCKHDLDLVSKWSGGY